MIQLRDADNTVLAGTHGRGFYTTTYLYDPTTRINDRLISSLNIYPNPTKGLISVELDDLINQPLTLLVYNSNFKVVKTVNLKSADATETIDLSDLSNGIYFISILSDHKSFNGKLVKH